MPAADLEDLRLHYELSGATRSRKVVFVHSLGANLRMWDKVAPRFERECCVLRYDVRGHGQSDVPQPPYTIEQLGRDLLGLLDELEWDRAYVCGLSLGGMVGIWAGIHAPGRVEGLILANTAARIGTRQGWEERIAAVKSDGMTPLAQTSLGRWFTKGYRQKHPQEMTQIKEMIERTPSEGYIGCCGVLRDTDLHGDLSRINAPCQVIAGSQDLATPSKDGQALHAALRRSAYAELEASHLSAWERAEEFAGTVLNFFNEKEYANG